MAELDSYRNKRDFNRTSEPSGEVPQQRSTSPRYVMHKHAASHDHFDLRLEMDGVLKSWALPKGPSLEPGEKHLAVEVEDHPLDYGDFEGVIPQNAYGGGTVMLWDRGHFKLRGKPGADRLDIHIEGERLSGDWTLTRMRGRSRRDHSRTDNQWLMIRRREGQGPFEPPGDDDRSVATGRTMAEIAEDRPPMDNPAGTVDPAALTGARRDSALPEHFELQLARLVSEVPGDEAWLHEIKLDGYRLMARLEAGECRLITRNGKDWSERLPEIAEALASLPVEQALLDGEVVSLAADGISSFRRLQETLSEGHTGTLSYQLFDIMYLDGIDLSASPLIERKALLAELLADTNGGGERHRQRISYCEHIEGQGPAFFEQACQLGLEGILSKRADSPYRGGRRDQWLKIKCGARQQELVVGGYSAPKGARSGFGALLLGAFDPDGRLEYAGRVGTGFNARQLDALYAALSRITRKSSPFNGPVRAPREVTWVRPELVIEVEYTELTRDGLLRHPKFRGVREDRDAEEIRTSTSAPQPRPQPGGDQARASRRQRGDEARVGGVRISHPERVVFPEIGLTKQALARYYHDVAEWMLPALRERPLSLLRCPEGWQQECFFQKHPHTAIAEHIPRLTLEERSGSNEYIYIRDARELVTLVQAGTTEFHPWGSRIDALDRPDCLILDLDPAPEVAWGGVRDTARQLRERLEGLGLAVYLRTTGGRGLHLVVPLKARHDWDEVHALARAVAQQQVRATPEQLTLQMARNRRHGRILIDYRRNERGSTAVASYSVRAREGAPVAVPIRWSELGSIAGGNHYTVERVTRRLAALKHDPWAGFEADRRRITAAMRRAVGLE